VKAAAGGIPHSQNTATCKLKIQPNQELNFTIATTLLMGVLDFVKGK
jgi:hypothetical protein